MDEPPQNPYAAPTINEEAPPSYSREIPVQASLGLRFANLIIDRIVCTILGGLLGAVIGFVQALKGADEEQVAISKLVGFLIGLAITLVYYAAMEALLGRTIGKLITGTKVIDSAGNKPSFGKALLRSVCRFIPFEPFSFLGSDNRGWHDSMTHTWVVKCR